MNKSTSDDEYVKFIFQKYSDEYKIVLPETSKTKILHFAEHCLKKFRIHTYQKLLVGELLKHAASKVSLGNYRKINLTEEQIVTDYMMAEIFDMYKIHKISTFTELKKVDPEFDKSLKNMKI